MGNKNNESVNPNEIFKCPGCGSNLKYDIDKQQMTCDFCGYSVNLSQTQKNEDHNFEDVEEEDDDRWTNTIRLAYCENCGAEVEVNSNDLSSKCPFCNTPMVVKEDSIKGMKPDKVIPFVVSQDIACTNYRTWIKKKFFASIKVKKNIPNPSIYSTYIPSWTYDSQVFCTYKGRLGEDYQVRVGSGKDAHYETRTRWFTISGAYSLFADDILVCSGQSITQKEIQSLEPFNTNDSIDFDNHYLAGHTTEHYKKSVKLCWGVAKDRIYEMLRRGILARYSYDHIDYLNIYPVYKDTKYKYVILPIWICHFEYNKTKYRFLVNGENGKISGKYPLSSLIISLIAVLVIALIIAIAFVVCKVILGS